ncbi:hypothetical protein Tco_1089629 [Tanacetum coccineum]
MAKGNEIIAIISDTSSDNNSSDSDSTSQISTFEEIDYSTPEYKELPKKIIVLSSDSSDYSKGVPEKGPSIQGLLDWYGYNTIKEYLSDTYFPSTYKDTTNKDSTNEDTILECYSPMSKGIQPYDNVGLKLVAGKHLQVSLHLHQAFAG